MLHVDAADQLRRAESLLEELGKLATLPEGENEYKYDRYENAARGFFIECWAIKDAIRADDRMRGKLDKPALEKRIDLSRELRACADVANRAKHPRLENPRTKPFSAAGHHFFTDLGTDTIEWMIDLGSGINMVHGVSGEDSLRISEEDLLGARDLGRICLIEWRHIFEELGLPLPKPQMANPFLAR